MDDSSLRLHRWTTQVSGCIGGRLKSQVVLSDSQIFHPHHIMPIACNILILVSIQFDGTSRRLMFNESMPRGAILAPVQMEEMEAGNDAGVEKMCTSDDRSRSGSWTGGLSGRIPTILHCKYHPRISI